MDDKEAKEVETTTQEKDTKKKHPEYKITKELGVLGNRGSSGWTIQLNEIQWDPNNLETKYDIRTWSPDRKILGKGISLNKDEALKLKDLLNSIES